MMSVEEVAEKWEQFRAAWYEDQQTHRWYVDFDEGWRVCALEHEGVWAYGVFNFFTKAQEGAEGFSSRETLMRNVFVQLLLWMGRITEMFAHHWLMTEN